MGHVKALEKISCKYPIRRIEVKVDTVPSGNMNYIQDNMFLGQLPKRLIIGCVDSDGLNWTITKNPFDFKLQDQFCGTEHGRTTDSRQTVTTRL